jgi:hypothetical protein
MAEPDDRDLRIRHLEEQLRWERVTLDSIHAMVDGLQYELHMRDLRIEELRKENERLRKRLEEQAPPGPPGPGAPAPPPPVVKPNKPFRRGKPGRKAGHPPALRPPPKKIDRRVNVPHERDESGRPICPCCRAVLSRMKRHRRLVEDLVPARVEVTCYHTASGWCSRCRKRFESRAPEQPPA